MKICLFVCNQIKSIFYKISISVLYYFHEVKKYIDLLNTDDLASNKFWKLEKRIKNDCKNSGVILQLRKSTMIFDIVSMINLKVISVDDINDFSEELKNKILVL